MDQLNIFDMLNPTALKAVSCFDQSTAPVEEMNDQARKLIPEGKYVIFVGEHPLVLKPTKLSAEDIPTGHAFYHYEIDGKVYAGTFIGKDTA